MSEENVETVRGIYREWERGNFRAGTDLFDHDTVLVLRTPLPEAGTYRGPEEIRGYMLSFLETWDDAAIEGESFIAVGDRVVVGVHQQATGIESSIPVAMRYFQVWSFRGGRILRIESIRERDQALEAAGLRD
ncbi:MAG: nuclear transport factor 2 family protein [Actinomycetota bacterium]|nr:nuclear transport factor 2 family protein [Actinomycetota bacterium]